MTKRQMAGQDLRRNAAFACAVLVFAVSGGLATGLARAQDIPGIENCSVEKDMARRTGCLQSNVNYLKAQLTQMQTVTFGRIEAANRQIDALKATIVSLQATVADLKTSVAKQPPNTAQKNDAQKSEPAKAATSNDPAKK